MSNQPRGSLERHPLKTQTAQSVSSELVVKNSMILKILGSQAQIK